jgi:hypothetical protein
MPPATGKDFIDDQAAASGDDTGDETDDSFVAADTGDDTEVEEEDGQDEKGSVDLGSSSSDEDDDWTAVTEVKQEPAKAEPVKKARAKPDKPRAKAPVEEKPPRAKTKSPRKSSQPKSSQPKSSQPKAKKAPVEKPSKPTIDVQSDIDEPGKPPVPEDKPKGKGKKAPPKSKAFAENPVDRRTMTADQQRKELQRFIDNATEDAQRAVANAVNDQYQKRKVRGHAMLGGTSDKVVTDDALPACKEFVDSFDQVPHTVDAFFNAKRALEEEGYTVQASITGAPSKRSKYQ